MPICPRAARAAALVAAALALTVLPSSGAPRAGAALSPATAPETLARAPARREATPPGYREGEALVRFRPGVDPGRYGMTVADRAVSLGAGADFNLLSARTGRLHALVGAPGLTTPQLLALLRQDPRVEHAQPNWVRRAVALPGDPLFPRLWGLHNTGQTIHGSTGVDDADIDAPEAWEVTVGSPDVVVASLDTGVDYTHRDLADRIWRNPGEIPGNGFDDDGNGYADDVFGLRLTTAYDPDPMDDNGHGTHTAGTMAASMDDGFGVAGVAPGVKVMALKFLDANGSGYEADAIRLILYAIRMKTEFGVNVVAINASWGGIQGSDGDMLSEAIAAAGEAGIVFVAAAGNDGLESDPLTPTRHYPSSYAVPTILAVAAADAADETPVWSNWGQRAVDLAAPGDGILSTVPGGTEGEIFFDDMESGDGNWTHQGTADTWAITGEDFFSGGHAWSDSPGGPPLTGFNAALLLARDLDLRPYAGRDVRFSFLARAEFLSGAFSFWVSRDGGASYEWGGFLDGRMHWTAHEFRIPDSFLTDRVRVAFHRMGGGGQYQGVFIDDVAVGVRGEHSLGYSFLSGTSMAAPHVSGAVALLASRFPADDALTRVRRILAGVDRLPQLSGIVASGGRLNAARSLQADAVLDPLLVAVSPALGVGAGDEITLRGIGFGGEAGRVTFASTPAPGWRRGPGFRVRFHFRAQGSPPDAREGERAFIDDVRILAGDRVLFADDLEQGQGNWVHGGRRDGWALTGEDAHASGTSWSAVPRELVWSETDSWLALARSVDLGPAGGAEAVLEFWSRTRLVALGEEVRVEISHDDGLTWRSLDALTGSDMGWVRNRYVIPRDAAEAEVFSWADGAVTVRVPPAAGRYVQVVRGDGRASNLLTAGSWVEELAPPENRTKAAAVAVGGRIYSLGGETDEAAAAGYPIVETAEVFRPGAGWSRIPPMGYRRRCFAAAALNGKVYAIGGEGRKSHPGPDDYGGTLDTVEAYDPAAKAWKPRAPLPRGMYAMGAAALGGKIYVAGGVPDGAQEPYYRTLLAYDPGRDAWEEKAPMREIRSFHALVALEGGLYAIGGVRAENFMAGEYRVLASGERYDPGTDTWSPIADLPAPRWGMAAATDGRFIYLLGGAARQGTQYSDVQDLPSLFIYDPGRNTWEDATGTLREPPRGSIVANLAWLQGRGLYRLGGMQVSGSLLGMERLTPTFPQRVTLREPTGGEALPAGSTFTVRWDAPEKAQTFSLHWSADGGRTWKRLAAGLRDRAFAWRVPTPRGSLDRCRLRVTGFDRFRNRVGADVSAGSFRITILDVPAPMVRMRELPSGEYRQYVAVSWTTHATSAPVASVELLHSLDDGLTWKPVTSLPGNPGGFTWFDTPDIPFPGSERCRLRVILRDAAGAALGAEISPRFFLERQGV
jgi:subtilisin family serine protease/N-acetylneuraminic acid mutarotase